MKTECWRDYFTVRKIRDTYYVARRGNSHNPPISPDFRTQGLARSWIKARWKELMMEEILLDAK